MADDAWIRPEPAPVQTVLKLVASCASGVRTDDAPLPPDRAARDALPLRCIAEQAVLRRLAPRKVGFVAD